MAVKSVRVWFDPEADFLEVIFDPGTAGYFRETSDDRVMEKVDEQDSVIGLSILSVSSLKFVPPLDVALGSNGGDD